MAIVRFRPSAAHHEEAHRRLVLDAGIESFQGRIEQAQQEADVVERSIDPKVRVAGVGAPASPP